MRGVLARADLQRAEPRAAEQLSAVACAFVQLARALLANTAAAAAFLVHRAESRARLEFVLLARGGVELRRTEGILSDALTALEHLGVIGAGLLIARVA